MSEKILKVVQVGANVAIIFLAVVLGAVLLKTYVTPQPTGAAAKAYPTVSTINATAQPELARDIQIQPGQKLKVPGVDFVKSNRTLLLAVSDKCHFCSESAPFYQQLAKNHGGARLIALMPQPPDEGRQYLDQLRVSVDEIRQAPLTVLGIRGTPTLILVDNAGAIVKSWRGKLSADKESEVLASLQ